MTRARKTLRKLLHDLAGKAEPRYDQLDDLDSWARSVRAKQA